jgi:ATP-dependent RNA helicase RhlE
LKFTELNLTDELQSGLKDINFLETTPVQEKSIPHILEGKDIIGTAQTGTGKTGAFVIPIVDRILRGKRDGIKAVILTPTRELAQQIDEQIFAIGYHTGISSATVIGGSDFSSQAKALNAGVDIIVATPGRFIDQNKIVNIDFSTVDYLILDEADRMLDMGFLPDIKKIISWMPQQRQTLLFSATMPGEIEKLAASIMKNPEIIEIDRSKPVQSVEQRAYLLKSNQKIHLTKQIFKTIDWDSCIIFTSTKKGTDELQRLLKKEGIKAGSIHGDRSQDERNKALNAFKTGQIPVIVATNVIARGIDIKNVSLIINYDVPRSADDYVHRIGRTGRYDKTGIAITFVTQRDKRSFAEIDKIKGNKLKKIRLPDSFDESTDFYWDKKESDGQKQDDRSAKQDKKGQKQSEKKKSSSNGRNKTSGKRGQEKKKDASTSGKKQKSGSGRNNQQKKTREQPSGKKGSQRRGNGRHGQESAAVESGRSDRSRPEKGSGRQKKSGGDGQGQQREPKAEAKRPVVIPPTVAKARERSRRTRKPAKGFWGIIKSIIPKFKRD